MRIWIALISICSLLLPATAIADPVTTTTAPVVTNIAGLLTIRGHNGSAHDVVSVQVLSAGDTLMTGVDGLAIVNLANVGRVRMGPGSTAQLSDRLHQLSLGLSTGSLCVSADGPNVSIATSDIDLTAGSTPTIFNIEKLISETKVIVYSGALSASRHGEAVGVFKAGDALGVSRRRGVEKLPASVVQPDFSTLRCPDDAVIAHLKLQPPATASETPQEQPAGSDHGGGGGGGGILGALLGLVVIGAAAGGHGGGGGGGVPANSAPATSTTPTPPGALAVNPTSMNFSATGSANSKTFTASESNYTGAINALSSNTSVATVSPASGSGPSQTFSVTPQAAGTATISVTDNHGGNTNVTINVAPPGSLAVNPSNLSFTALGPTNSQPFTASEANYSGSIAASSSNLAVAAVSPASGSGPTQTFTVTPVGPGSATIAVSDDHGGTQSVSVTVTPPGALTVKPASLTFSNTGDGNDQTFAASETNYAGPINASTADATVATVTPASGIGPNQTFIVKPIGPGHTTVSVTDNHGGSASVSITVTVPGALTVNPTSLSFNGTGSSKNQTFTASESNYSGPLSALSSNPVVATVSPSTGNGPNQTFTVTPLAAGSATIIVTDNHGGSASVNVSVTPPGALTVNPTSLSFSGTGSSNNKPFVASETNYAGSINAVVTNPAIATVSPASGNGPNQTFIVTPQAAGSTTISVTDDHGGTQTVTVNVAPPGSLTLTPTSLTFDRPVSAAKTFTASETNYTGSFFIVDPGCLGIASVSPSPGTGPSQAFTVTPQGAGTCSITVTDDHGGIQTENITVFDNLSVSPTSLSFNDVGSSNNQPFSATESFYSGPLSAASQNTNVATVSPSSGSGPSKTFTVTPRGSGSTNIIVTDNHGGSVSVAITVGPFGAFTVSPTNLTFTDVNVTSSVSVSENNYSGPFAIGNNTCAGIATVSGPSSNGPNATISVTSNSTASGGTCSFAVTNDHGGNTTVNVTVGQFVPVSPTPNSLTFNGTGSANNKTFTVSESNYTGSFSVTPVSCGGVASVSPTSGDSSTTFTVTPQGAGSCSLSVADDHGQTASVSISVAPFGTLTVNPPSLSFTGTGTANNQSFNASETNYTGPINAVSNNTAIATVSPASGNGPGPVTFTVTPVAAGNTTITVTDNHGGSATVSVSVTPPGPLSVDKSSLSFTGTGSANNQSFNASETNYTGPIGATSNNTAIATVSPASGNGPGPVTFTVTPVAAGNTTITVTDNHGGSATVSVSVTLPGSLTVDKTSMSFTASGQTATFHASESNYTGLISAVTSNASVATVSPASANGPGPVTFTVTSQGVGNSKITVTDDHGGVRTLTVSVTAGTLTVDKTTIQLSGAGSTDTFAATDSAADVATTYTATSADPTIATVSPSTATGTGSKSFTVTAVAASGRTSITVTDSKGGTAVVSVGVGSTTPLFVKRKPIVLPVVNAPQPDPGTLPRVSPDRQPPSIRVPHNGRPFDADPVELRDSVQAHPLFASAMSLMFSDLKSIQVVTASEIGYTGALSAQSSNPAVATVSMVSGSGQTRPFIIQAQSPGMAIVRIADDHGGTVIVMVTVSASSQPANSGMAPSPSPQPAPGPLPRPQPEPDKPRPEPPGKP